MHFSAEYHPFRRRPTSEQPQDRQGGNIFFRPTKQWLNDRKSLSLISCLPIQSPFPLVIFYPGPGNAPERKRAHENGAVWNVLLPNEVLSDRGHVPWTIEGLYSLNIHKLWCEFSRPRESFCTCVLKRP